MKIRLSMPRTISRTVNVSKDNSPSGEIRYSMLVGRWYVRVGGEVTKEGGGREGGVDPGDRENGYLVVSIDTICPPGPMRNSSITLHSSILVLLLLAGRVPSIAQSRRIDSVALARRGWLRLDSTQQYRKVFPALSAVPPFSPGLPWQRAVELMVLDSVCRGYSPNMLDNLIQQATPASDTLCRLYSAMYQLRNYNPSMVEQYDIETKLAVLDRVMVYNGVDTVLMQVGRYRSNVSTIEDVLARRLKQDYGQSSSFYARHALLFSDVIVSGRVVRVDSNRQEFTGYDGIPVQYYYRVTLEVADTIKGMNGTVTEGAPQQIVATTNDARYLTFDYSTSTYLTGVNNPWQVWFPVVDSSFLNVKNELRLRSGDTIAVFLRYQAPLLDTGHDYLRLSIATDCSLGVMRISGASIVDPNNVWGQGTGAVPYSLWRSAVEALRSSIINCP